MRRAIVSLGLALGSLFAAATPGNAQVPPPISNRPAATLLLPYFEVNLDNGQGMNTIFSVNNASATAVLAHVSIWSDMGVPVLNFDVYLTGFDTQRIDLRSVLQGNLPATASAGQDPTNTISPQGIVSQDINFASCNGTLPYQPLSAGMVAHVRAALTGKPSPVLGGQCASRNHGTPSIARGYVTVDTVTQCSSMFPSDVGYFVGFVASRQNVLWGEYMMLDPSKEFAFADPLVHILADFNGVSDPDIDIGRYTFYGRYVAWTAADEREPLSTKFQARFIAAKDFKSVSKARRRPFLPAGTELIVWRDPKFPTANSFNCASKPAWFPLSQTQIIFFNEQEGAEQLDFDALPFPGVTQRVTVASADLPVTFYSGFVHLNLNTFTLAPGPPLLDPSTSQAWVTVLQRALQGPNGGRYEAGFRAIRLDSARNPDLTIY